MTLTPGSMCSFNKHSSNEWLQLVNISTIFPSWIWTLDLWNAWRTSAGLFTVKTFIKWILKNEQNFWRRAEMSTDEISLPLSCLNVSLSLSLSLSLSIYLPIYLGISLSINLCVCLGTCLSISLSTWPSLSVYMAIFASLSIYKCICLYNSIY